MTCAELEILLCDYVDGTLRGAEKSALESHLAECSACAELAKDVAGVTAFIDTVATAEPPAELLTRILHVIPNGRQKTERPSWWRKLFGGWVNTVLSPRYAMKIWAGIDDRAHRSWDRAVKYYDNLRLVIEIQSRLKEWTDQDASQVAESNKQPSESNKQMDKQHSQGSGQKPEAGTNQKRN